MIDGYEAKSVYFNCLRKCVRFKLCKLQVLTIGNIYD